MNPEQEQKTPSVKKEKKKRLPRKISKSYLQNAALYYLQRYSSSSENLRQVLLRKVRRSAYHFEADEHEAAVWIDDIVERYLRSGLLDDTAYAETKVRAFRGRGNSNKLITAKLSAKGISAAVIHDALAAVSEKDGDAELDAAIRFAKRRRLGPFGDPGKRESRRDKSLAAMARAGFNFDLARQIIDTPEESGLLAHLKAQSDTNHQEI